ncbi:protein FAM200B-like [Oratosquilla oratoria]|uniref:protein FAM200B-like n=1 Tax=Oratosquilla oratoria TaxID=337810 RepID=UPI003F759486
MSIELNTVMVDMIQIVGFIRSSALNSRLFNQMCSDIQLEFEHLLYCSSVRWLFRGKVLQRVLDARAEVEIFLNEKKHALSSKLSDPGWLVKLAYQSDIFSELNLLNMSMQGKDGTPISVPEKFKSFKAKMRLWKEKIEQGTTRSFPLLNLFLEDEEDASLLDIQNVIVGHLKKLSGEFDRPFEVHAEDLSEEESSVHNLQEKLVEVQHDETLDFNF